SRDFRGLRVWLPLKLFGIEPFREQLDEKLDLIEYAASELRKMDGIEMVAEPQLTILAFRVQGDDARNHALLDAINARKRVMLTGATVEGRFVIRVAVVSHRTHRDRIEMMLEDVRATLATLQSTRRRVDEPPGRTS
ncbi:MAG TPA: pyridoxal-dependent decarboxylase, partial [Thermoanaerobaculia bacterium]|nr:pyridoxal-dependent decarboxylase [Thermoanaerobaculia bacterium]